MNKLLTVKISFVLAYNYVSLSNIWACLCAQQLSAAVIAQVNYLHWKPEYTSFPALCTRNTPCLAFLPPGSRNNSELPEKTILISERGRRRKHVLWCRVAHAHTEHTAQASTPALRKPAPVSSEAWPALTGSSATAAQGNTSSAQPFVTPLPLLPFPTRLESALGSSRSCWASRKTTAQWTEQKHKTDGFSVGNVSNIGPRSCFSCEVAVNIYEWCSNNHCLYY